MTDRFYPIGKVSAHEVWKTSYEVQNEMRSFQRSAYPPGYAGHEPGAREKFGFSTPGPDAQKLTKSELALREDIDILEPRRIHAMPRLQVTDDRHTFRLLDTPEMDRTYKSGIVSPSYRSMAKTRSLPSLDKMPAPPRLSQVPDAQAKLEDGNFSYFVPRALNREGVERLMSRSLPKLYKHPERKVMLPFAGDGTGFRTQCSDTEWWPAASRLQGEQTSYASHFTRPAFYRMSPLDGIAARSSSVHFNPPGQPDGCGSIRLGTPTTEERAQKHPHFLPPSLDSNIMQKESSFPLVKPTPAARFGYMPPTAGRLDRSSSSSSKATPVKAENELSDALLAKILKLYRLMDVDDSKSITRAEAKAHFKNYAKVSADAMFNEVDEDGNNEITLQEFVEFWQQVKNSGYAEEDLSDELDELIAGNVWVDYKDSRDVGPADY